MAASIVAHGLVQSLSVRAVINGYGQESGKYEVVAGGRRLAALRLLAKRKAMAKTAPVPRLVQAAGEPEELSLAENVVREPLHPADQFEAFKRLHEGHGLGAEEIAARFGVTPAVLRQRLRLGAASPVLMALYREGTINLDQLAALYPGGYDPGTCPEIEPKARRLRSHAPGIDDAPASRAIALRHDQWARQMPAERAGRWAFVAGLDHDCRMDLLAYGAARTGNAVAVGRDRRPCALAHADALAQAVGLDMAAWWTPTVDGYLGRVTKVRILEAVREGVSVDAADRLGSVPDQHLASACRF